MIIRNTCELNAQVAEPRDIMDTKGMDYPMRILLTGRL